MKIVARDVFVPTEEVGSVLPANARLIERRRVFLLVSQATAGAASRNRTDDTCLEGRGFTIKL